MAPDETAARHSDEYYLAMAALDNYESLVRDHLPKSTSVVYRIHQLGHALERALAAPPPRGPDPGGVGAYRQGIEAGDISHAAIRDEHPRCWPLHAIAGQIASPPSCRRHGAWNGRTEMIDYKTIKAGDRLRIVGQGAPGFAKLGDVVIVKDVRPNRCDVVNDAGEEAYFALTCGAARLEMVPVVDTEGK